MTVGIELGSIIDEVGTGDFFHAFFSTISDNLEPKGWGSRFPAPMNKLYQGEVTQPDAAAALAELDQASAELAKLPVSKMIWHVEDRSKTPPWGNHIAKTITDLSNNFRLHDVRPERAPGMPPSRRRRLRAFAETGGRRSRTRWS